MSLSLTLLPVLLILLSSNESLGCPQMKNMSNYTQALLEAIRPTSRYTGTLHLPMRFIAGVHLYRGELIGFHSLELIEEPSRLFCFNETLAALQTKVKASNISTGYEFTFASTPEVTGLITLPKQDFFMDIDFERDFNAKSPELLGLYLSQPMEEFTVDITKGSENQDIKKITFHVQTITKMIFSRDVRITLLNDFSPRIESFISSHDIDLKSS